MIQTDLIGAIVRCPTALDDKWQPTKFGVGVVRGVFCRRARESTFVEVIVQTLDHLVGKVDTAANVNPAWLTSRGGYLRSWDLKHCRLYSNQSLDGVFAPGGTVAQ